MMRPAGAVACMLMVLAPAAWAGQPAPASLPAPGYVDDALFRDALRQRGLHAWVQQFEEDTPGDELSRRLRSREALLERAASCGDPVLREALVIEATGILRSLLAEHPHHPARWRWYLDIVTDLLDRQRPESFDAVLLYEMAGRHAAQVKALSRTAVETLESARSEIAAAWAAVEELDEAAIDGLTRSGYLLPLQQLDEQSALLMGWARLYEALAGPDAGQVRTAMSDLLIDATQRFAWTQAAPGFEVRQCNGLVIAAIAARCSGRTADADRYAREFIATLQKVRSPIERRRLGKLALVGVLEQIRALRDAGKATEALQAIDQARAWAARSRSDDLQAQLAIAMAEGRLRVRGTTSAPEGNFDPTTHAASLEPLRSFATSSAAHRDLLYGVLGGTDATMPAPGDILRVQLWAGALVRESCQAPGSRQRLERAVALLGDVLARLSQDAPAVTRGELMFLLGRVQACIGARNAAISTLSDLAETTPEHDRAASAARIATASAEEWLREGDGMESAGARHAFIRAARLFRKTPQGASQSAGLSHAIAVVLEKDGQFEAAADEYAGIQGAGEQGIAAALGAARCLHAALDRAAGEGRPAAELKAIAGRAIEAARSALAAQTATAPEGTDCRRGETVLLLAALMNHPDAGRAEDAVAALDGFERRFAQCPGLVGPALRERILALRQLNRMAEARQVVEQFLATDPQGAGPVMATLLEAMRAETEAALERGDAGAARSIAEEGAELALSLVAWVNARGDDIPARDRLAIRLWRAWSLLQSGRAEEAGALYAECAREQESLAPDSALRIEITLGEAETRLALGRAAEALPMFTEVWRRCPERTPYWWRAFAGSLRCHTATGGDAHQIVQSIRQQRHLAPDLGGPRWKRILDQLERENLATTRPVAGGPGPQDLGER